MSGGSMDYLCFKVEDANFAENTVARKAFRTHLKKVAKALHAIEWNDSGDGHHDEYKLIMDCISTSELLDEAIKQAESVKNELSDILSNIKDVT